MNLKIGYYPLFDMVLALRQLFSQERFKPFNDILTQVESKLSPDDTAFIQAIGTETRGWLKVIEKLINIHVDGMTNTEEIILDLLKNADCLFQDVSDADHNTTATFLQLWKDIFNTETSKHSKKLLEKSIEIHDRISAEDFPAYLTGVSDRVRLIDHDTMQFMIKPDHKEKISHMKTVIIMPSVFAVRHLTFWHSGKNYIFFVSMNAPTDTAPDPSDNLMLKTMALNDKTRLKMLKILGEGPCSSTEMADRLNVNPSTISRHFKLFKDAGFVEVFTQEGNTVYYTLNKKEIQTSFNMILDYIDA